ncbi:MAG: hypothetical protein LBQ75_05190 [Zoogloeaceae bacterium]|jgi:hypothetical protein|nr:hypothetical protein [Zoogloeaceae bacterium]
MQRNDHECSQLLDPQPRNHVHLSRLLYFFVKDNEIPEAEYNDENIKMATKEPATMQNLHELMKRKPGRIKTKDSPMLEKLTHEADNQPGNSPQQRGK